MLPASSVCLLSLADKKSVPYSEMVPALSEMICAANPPYEVCTRIRHRLCTDTRGYISTCSLRLLYLRKRELTAKALMHQSMAMSVGAETIPNMGNYCSPRILLGQQDYAPESNLGPKCSGLCLHLLYHIGLIAQFSQK